ncbi:MAG: class I SAM-dependent methyltransferase, partial [Pseudomonadales bacterium]|nr:class I SAM-dependent methyltransferase [Pseudomonadales bacterium]
MEKRNSNAFFDSQDILLNIEQTHTWGNFGYWENTQRYATACEQLAKKLGTEAKLQAQDHVLDLGFGCGDQLQVWNQHFGVEHIEGWNISQEQYAIALQKHYDCNVELHCGDFFSKTVYDQAQYDKILALDSAYHFNTRSRFFEFAHQHL